MGCVAILCNALYDDTSFRASAALTFAHINAGLRDSRKTLFRLKTVPHFGRRDFSGKDETNPNPKMICTLCSSTLVNKKDEYYFDCDTCKAIVKDKKHYLTADEEKAIYELHNNDVNDIRYQNFTMPITNYVIDKFLPEHKGLDFGSGTGPVISSMLMKKDYDIVQYDPFFAPTQNILNNRYDYIVSCEVFEHFYNPKIEIDNLTSLLKVNGMLLIMTLLYNDQIDFNKWNYRNDPTHVFIYRKETIEYIAKENQLEIDILTDRFIVLRKTDTHKA